MMLFALRRRIALAICPELRPRPWTPSDPNPLQLQGWLSEERAQIVNQRAHQPTVASRDDGVGKGAPGPDEGHSAPGRDDLILQLRADQEALKGRIDDLEADVSVLRAQLSLVEAEQWQLLSTPPSAPTPSDPLTSEGGK